MAGVIEVSGPDHARPIGGVECRRSVPRAGSLRAAGAPATPSQAERDVHEHEGRERVPEQRQPQPHEDADRHHDHPAPPRCGRPGLGLGSGAEAARIALANHCVPDGELEAKVAELAEAIAGQSRHSVFAYKRLYREAADLPLAAGLAHEVFNGAGVGPDFAERVSGQFGK